MKRLATILLIICAFNINVNAYNKNVSNVPRLTFGAEWGYVGTFHYAYSFNFFATEGYRFNKTGSSFNWSNNGEVNLHLGYNLNHHWNLALYGGLTGLMNMHNAVPISLRATYLFGEDHLADRWLAFADLGTGVDIKKEPQGILSGKLGGGYRFSLSRDTKLDIIAALRLTHTHPQIISENEIISLKWVNKNSAFLSAIFIGISLTL
ncbi:MAG: hypothetical protein IKW27_03525 [Bacteroidales bacterium]|nr:hypothetical protein [Bacteroidales bacterium]